MHTGDKCAKKKTNTDIARLVMTIHVHCFHHNHHLRKKKRKETYVYPLLRTIPPNNMKNSNDRIVSVKSRFFFLRSTTKKKR